MSNGDVDGHIAYFSENRAFDLALDQACFENAIALARPHTTCAIVDRSAGFESAMLICLLQTHRDKRTAAGGARPVYMPLALDLADKR